MKYSFLRAYVFIAYADKKKKNQADKSFITIIKKKEIILHENMF